MSMFENLFILDIANNHQGDIEHGQNIIQSLGKVVRELDVKAAIKFQFRQLETFIHPDYTDSNENKHIQRFIGTKLIDSDYAKLVDIVRQEGMYAMCTPFDEESVRLILEMGFDAIKVASCSVTDYPLLETVCNAGLPIVASTGGASIVEIERMVHILSSNNVELALEHCVSIYPTPQEKMQLNQIVQLKEHFRGIPIGWSTHESPDDLTTVQLAVAKGATLFERHVGIQTDEYQLNDYSSTPDRVRAWMLAQKKAIEICGSPKRPPASPQEAESLRLLKRGVFAKAKIVKGEEITRDQVFFAMPSMEGYLTTTGWRERIVADRDYTENEPLLESLVKTDRSEDEYIYQIILQLKGMLMDARIQLRPESTIELSHHYGLKKFREFGAIIIDVINREYCKKLIVLLPRQKHPYHYHKLKEETFQVLYGSMEVE